MKTSSTSQSRRDFLKTTGGAGVLFWLGLSSAKGETVKALSAAEAKRITPYIQVEANGAITIFNIKPEMGQGTFQSIPALIAEELEVSLSQVTILATNGEKELGKAQRAGGSSSVRTSYQDLRKVGAAAKEMFLKAATMQWQVDLDTCYVEDGTVIHRPTKRALTYGELAQTAAKLDVPKEPKLKDAKDFKILGKSVKRPDIPLKVNGKAEFGIDVRLPNMLYASVERCPVLGGTLKSFDATEALKVPGVEKVVEAERVVGKYHYTGVAVIAGTYWAARKGRQALKVEWDTKGYEMFSTTDYEKQLRSLASQEGIIDKDLSQSEAGAVPPDRMIEAFYETPMVAHHALEPMNCVAHVQGKRVEIWTSTQVPSSLTGDGEDDLHKYIGFDADNIRMHTKFIGGGFGRRLYLDFIIEAVNIAKQVKQPVKVVWSREDTTVYGPFRPMTFSQLKGGVSADGKTVSFGHKVISPSYFDSIRSGFEATKIDPIMIEGISEQSYEVTHLKTAYVRADYHVPVAAWRSVTSSTVSFADECFLDELAHQAGKDPLAFRLGLLTKESDTKRVLLKLKEVSGWDKPLPKGKGRGIAQWQFFAGLCGQVVEVSKQKDGSIKVDKVVAVIDLGEVVNPDTVKAQVEGAIVMALGAATQPGITLAGGKVEQSNFHNTPIPRINEIPRIEVYILAEGGKIKGVGEPGLPPFAPALGNAIFAATGKRVRKLPVDLSNV